VLALAVREVAGDGFPLAQVRVHQPVDQLVHLAFHLLRHVRHYFAFEVCLQAFLFDQVRHTCQAKALLKELISALLHLEENILYLCHAQREGFVLVALVQLLLALDIAQQVQVFFQDLALELGSLAVFLHQVRSHPQGVEEFEPYLTALVQRFADVAFERLEVAGLPKLRFASLGTQCLAGTHCENFWCGSQQGTGIFFDKSFHLTQFILILQQVHLIDHDHHFFTPVADLLHKAAFALCEWAVDRSDEDHQVGTRHKVGCERFMLADDGVRAGCVHDRDLRKQVHWQQDDLVVFFCQPVLGFLAKAQDVDL